MKKTFVLVLLGTVLLLSCGGGQQEKQGVNMVKDTIVATPVVNTKTESMRPPIINITDTLSVKRLIIYMKDSAATAERIALKLPEILGFKLDAVIKKNKLTAMGRPMAWYNNNKAPFFFEAGIPVDKRPARLPSNVYVRETGTDSVTVAHFYGNYQQLPMAYEALENWLKDHNKTLHGKPYEIYVDDPSEKDGKMKDPYKVQTDVVFPWK